MLRAPLACGRVLAVLLAAHGRCEQGVTPRGFPGCRLTVRLLTPRGGNVPSARGYHSLVALGSSLVLFGGKEGATLSSHPLAVFDYPKRQWSYPGASRCSVNRDASGLKSSDVRTGVSGRVGTSFSL